MSCPRCESHITDGFYCVRCGYVPTAIDLAAASDPDTANTQTLRGILKAPSGNLFVEMPAPYLD
jgi:hypothetical protein